MTLQSYARPGVWAPLLVAIAIGIYFIVSLNAGSASDDPSRKLGEARVVLTIFGDDASAEVNSPLILEHEQTLQVALNFDFDLTKLRSLYVRLEQSASPRILQVRTPNGIRPGWSATVPDDSTARHMTFRYARSGLQLVITGAYVYGLGGGSFVARVLASSQEFNKEEVTALHHRDWVTDPALLAAWTPEIAVFSGEEEEGKHEPAEDALESGELPEESED